MADSVCGVCNSAPKKYKCPTCTLPYCSLACFKLHKPTHPEPKTSTAPATTTPTEPEIPRPSVAPKPPPKYLQNKLDFSLVATNPKFQDMLKRHPTLLPTLQRVYAKTIEPEPDDSARGRGKFNGYRGRGGRGRGRGRGGWHGKEEPKWTQKKGDNDALKLLRRVREGKEGGDEMKGLAEFRKLVQETFGEKDEDEEMECRDGDMMDMV